MSAVLDAHEPSARYLVAPALVHQFELLATAPGGIARLRDLILSLAVQGKLVPQDPSDEPAHQLVKTISAEKDRLIADGRLKPDKSLSAATDPHPFEIPGTWTWVPMGEVVEIVRGITFPASEKTREAAPGRIACLRTANVQESIEWNDLLFVNRSFMGRKAQLLKLHDIVISMANSRELVGKVALVDRIPHTESTFGGFLGVLRPWKIDPRYAMAILRSSYARSTLIDSSSQTTNIANISLGKLRPLPFSLPPIAEQARIVARVDELMRLCGALEAKGRLEAEQHARLLGTLLGTLTDSSTPEELAANWQRVADHFDLLLDRPEAVDALEQTVLQLAVRGLLLPQDPSEDPATVLIEQIQAARAGQLADASRRKARAELPEVEHDEWPFEPPPGWAWTRFGEVTQVSGGVTLGRKGAIASPVSRPYLRVANVQRWELALDSMKDIVVDEAELPRYQLAEGDLLITEGGDWDKVGRTAIWRSELPECLHQNHVFKARGYTTTWNPNWAELYLNLDVARAYFAASAKQTTNLASINMTELRHCVFPLPPLNEQARIITRVTELRRVCTELRQRLASSRTTQSHLAEALVDEVA